MAKIAIIVGHNPRAQGAVRVSDRRTEYDWCGALADEIRALAPNHVQVFRREAGLAYSAEIDRVYATVNQWGANCSIELHFNGGPASATGTETLTSGTTGSGALAALVQAACLRTLGLRDRGIKTLARANRGGRSLWAGRAPAVMAEPFFGSNASDCAAASQNMDALAVGLLGAAQEFIKRKGK